MPQAPRKRRRDPDAPHTGRSDPADPPTRRRKRSGTRRASKPPTKRVDVRRILILLPLVLVVGGGACLGFAYFAMLRDDRRRAIRAVDDYRVAIEQFNHTLSTIRSPDDILTAREPLLQQAQRVRQTHQDLQDQREFGPPEPWDHPDVQHAEAALDAKMEVYSRHCQRLHETVEGGTDLVVEFAQVMSAHRFP